MDGKLFTLAVEEELRIEVGEAKGVMVKLEYGQGEIFGTEMVARRPYELLPGDSIAVFTWHGCKLRLQGAPDAAYVSKESPMPLYLNLHASLEGLRDETAAAGQAAGRAAGQAAGGPRLMIVGGQDVGKSTLATILVNYAARVGRSPMLVDLDVSRGQVCLPGTMGAAVVDRPADIETGFSDVVAPLSFHFGHTTPEANMDLYSQLISSLAEAVKKRCSAAASRGDASGVIISTSSACIRGGGYRALVHAAGAFEVDVVVVLQQERLYNDLQRDLAAAANVKLLYLPKSGGVVQREEKQRMHIREKKIREYFYGAAPNTLHPHSLVLPFANMPLFKLGAPQASRQEPPSSSSQLVPLSPSPSLKHRLVSVTTATPTDVTRRNLLGFIVITDVDMEKQRYTVLAPAQQMPRSIGLVMENSKFFDM